MTVALFITSVLTGAIGLGPVIYATFEHVHWFKYNISDDNKRVAVAVTSGLLGIALWGLGLWIGIIPVPVIFSPDFLVNGLWNYGLMLGFSAFTSSQLIHGQLSKGSQNERVIDP